MGFDPPQLGEVYEVCIQLEGPVNDPNAFVKFEQDLKQCIKKLGTINDPTSPTGKLRVKRTKGEVKEK